MSNLTSTARPIAGGDTSGNAKFIDVLDVTTPGSEQVLFTEVVSPGSTINILQLTVVCRSEGAFKLSIDSTVIATGRTGAAQSNVFFPWRPFRAALSGETIELKYTQLPGKPAVDVEAFLQAREIT